MRARGLKHTAGQRRIIAVAPLRARGLKQNALGGHEPQQVVAPHAGAWIETNGELVARHAVAPHAGAWIETGTAGR